MLIVAASFAVPWWLGTLGLIGKATAVGGGLAVAGLYLIGRERIRVFLGFVAAIVGLVLLLTAAFAHWGLPWLVEQGRAVVHTGVEKVVDDAQRRATSDVWQTIRDKIGATR